MLNRLKIIIISISIMLLGNNIKADNDNNILKVIKTISKSSGVSIAADQKRLSPDNKYLISIGRKHGTHRMPFAYKIINLENGELVGIEEFKDLYYDDFVEFEWGNNQEEYKLKFKYIQYKKKIISYNGKDNIKTIDVVESSDNEYPLFYRKFYKADNINTGIYIKTATEEKKISPAEYFREYIVSPSKKYVLLISSDSVIYEVKTGKYYYLPERHRDWCWSRDEKYLLGVKIYEGDETYDTITCNLALVKFNTMEYKQITNFGPERQIITPIWGKNNIVVYFVRNKGYSPYIEIVKIHPERAFEEKEEKKGEKEK